MKKKQGMTREQAAKLYDSLKTSMEKKYGKKGLADLIAEERSSKGAKGTEKARSVPRRPVGRTSRGLRPLFPSGGGQASAIAVFTLLAVVKLGVSIIDYSGALEVQDAEASLNAIPQTIALRPQFDKEEVEVLQSLDHRRVELVRRKEQLDEREEELERRDREFAVKLTELRELTDLLKTDREQNDRKRQAQLDQLANVYGSMNPKEAAGLMEQLDVLIALRLIERMPEKRIGQILALMSPERALAITQMISGSE